MKKTYNINISGRAFVIDEDAYTLLSDYLDTLRHAFINNPENSELIADIECRIAEIFTDKILAGQQIITLGDVEAIISRIGRPEDFLEIDESLRAGDSYIEEEVATDIHEANNDRDVPPPYCYDNARIGRKKLFRDGQDGMIGGVCAGLAFYLGMDVTWVRLITVGLCFISLSTLCMAYIILWIVLPNADTPLRRMEMKGESPTISNIGQNVTDTFRRRHDENSTVQDSSAPKFANNLANFFGILGKIALLALTIISIPIAFALVIGFVGCLLALIIFATGNMENFFNGALVAQFNYNDVIFALLTALGYIIVLSIPLITFLMYGLNIKKCFNKTQKSALIATWIIGFLMAGIFTGLLINAHNNRFSSSELEDEGKEPEFTEVVYDSTESSVEISSDSISIQSPAINVKVTSK